MNRTIDEAWNDLNLESTKYLLDQTEKYLEATIETAKVLTDRAVSILQFSIPIILALVGVIFAQSNTILIHLSVISIVFLIVVSFKALRVYELYEIHCLGSPPESLLVDDILIMSDEHKEFAFIFNSVKLNNDMIIFNQNSNRQREKHLRFIITTVKTGCAFVLLYAIFWFPVFRFLFEVVV